MDFSDTELERFSRQILADDVGGRGQRRWRESTVHLYGEEALLAPCAVYLERAGIGQVVLQPLDPIRDLEKPRDVLAARPGAAQHGWPPVLRVFAGGDPSWWHAQANSAPATHGSLWLAVRGHLTFVASWAVPQPVCPLDEDFFSAWTAACRPEVPHDLYSPLYAWSAATLAATLALRSLLLAPEKQLHAWFAHDFSTGMMLEPAASGAVGRSAARCPYCTAKQ